MGDFVQVDVVSVFVVNPKPSIGQAQGTLILILSQLYKWPTLFTLIFGLYNHAKEFERHIIVKKPF